jgi:hypothetical protein
MAGKTKHKNTRPDTALPGKNWILPAAGIEGNRIYN